MHNAYNNNNTYKQIMGIEYKTYSINLLTIYNIKKILKEKNKYYNSYYIQNHTWCLEIPDSFLVLNMISHSFAALTREITLEINLVFPSPHVLFCM